MTEIQEGCRLVGGAGSIVGHSIIKSLVRELPVVTAPDMFRLTALVTTIRASKPLSFSLSRIPRLL